MIKKYWSTDELVERPILDSDPVYKVSDVQHIVDFWLNTPDSHWEIGKPYFIRTVTHHFTGILVKVGTMEIVLKSASWIPDDGRFSDAVRTGMFDEVEPFPEGMSVIIGRASLIDAVQIPSVPRSQQ